MPAAVVPIVMVVNTAVVPVVVPIVAIESPARAGEAWIDVPVGTIRTRASAASANRTNRWPRTAADSSTTTNSSTATAASSALGKRLWHYLDTDQNGDCQTQRNLVSKNLYRMNPYNLSRQTCFT